MEMFMMNPKTIDKVKDYLSQNKDLKLPYTLQDVIECAETVRNKIKIIEAEKKAIDLEHLKLLKSYAEICTKLNKMCDCEWEKTQLGQFSPLVCKKCNMEKEQV